MFKFLIINVEVNKMLNFFGFFSLIYIITDIIHRRKKRKLEIKTNRIFEVKKKKKTCNAKVQNKYWLIIKILIRQS